MPINPLNNGLESIVDAVREDPGLPVNIYQEDIDGGAAAAQLMNSVILEAIRRTGVNADGVITPAELMRVSDAIRADQSLYAQFVNGHGDDEGNSETGFHLVQGDGGAFEFQGRDFIDTVADAIYHVGFIYNDGRFVNEDGNANETVADVAGWLNYFLNGRNRVFGTNAGETLNSGHYSFPLAAAADEVFQAAGGDDSIWAGDGNDYILAGTGDDRAGGGQGNDRIYGEAGNDVLSGDEGDDMINGGHGNDRLHGDEGRDHLIGGLGNDKIYGGDDDDILAGQHGNDEIGGGQGNDLIRGGLGNDRLWGDEGADRILGENGDDRMYGNDGNDGIIGGFGHDTAYGGTGNDLIYGQNGYDKLHGQEGNDFIRGGNHADELYGGSGSDRLFGDAGADKLDGGEGADSFVGGAGADRMYAWDDDNATDTFFFAAGDSGVDAGTYDIIYGFETGQDKINLRALGPMEYGENNLIGGGVASVAYDGDFVLIDVNGNGRADMLIELKYVADVQESDFILA